MEERKAIVVNGTTYQPGTPTEVIGVLESCRENRTRVVIETGDPETGRCHEEEKYAGRDRGKIGRTTGNRSPILVHNARSMGGQLISTANVLLVRTTVGGVVLYKHPKFHYSEPA